MEKKDESHLAVSLFLSLVAASKKSVPPLFLYPFSLLLLTLAARDVRYVRECAHFRLERNVERRAKCKHASLCSRREERGDMFSLLPLCFVSTPSPLFLALPPSSPASKRAREPPPPPPHRRNKQNTRNNSNTNSCPAQALGASSLRRRRRRRRSGAVGIRRRRHCCPFDVGRSFFFGVRQALELRHPGDGDRRGRSSGGLL